uniref:Sushi domain-containing protein n=1 Tax=Caenorhabditis japonica TaxID=281687 RepID=A0A8R1HHA8_CAEJA
MPTLITSTTTTPEFNCYWLDETFYFILSFYEGTCCDSQSVDYLNENYGSKWSTSPHAFDKIMYVTELLDTGYCGSSTFKTDKASTTLPSTTTPQFDCSWLEEPFTSSKNDQNEMAASYNASCCTQTAVDAILGSKYSRKLNYFPSYQTRWNILTNFLYCVEGACTEPNPVWTNCSDYSTTTTLTTTADGSTSTTQSILSSTGPPFNCLWLSEPFMLTQNSENVTYDGSCCSPTAMNALKKSSFYWITGFDRAINRTLPNRWMALTSVVFCVDGACTGAGFPWSNCSETLTTTTSDSLSSELLDSTSSSFSTTKQPKKQWRSTLASSTASEQSESFSSSSTSSSSSEETSVVTQREKQKEPQFSTQEMEDDSTKAGGSTFGTSTLESSSSPPEVSTFKSTAGIVESSASFIDEKTSSEATHDDISTTASPPFQTTNSTTPTPAPTTTTFPWPTGGTTRILPSGEIKTTSTLTSTTSGQTSSGPSTTSTFSTASRSATSLPSTVSTPQSSTSDNLTTKYESSESTMSTSSATSATSNPTTTTFSPSSAFTTSTEPATTSATTQGMTTNHLSTTIKTTTPSDLTTTFNWPTGGTTRMLPNGEIILSEAWISYQNCTTVLRQLIYNPSTNTTRTEVTTDPEGCKATTTTTASPGGSSTPSTNSEHTTTFAWPTGGTTRVLPSGEIKATTTTTASPGGSSTPSTNSEHTTTFAWPTGGTTRVLPSGEIKATTTSVSSPGGPTTSSESSEHTTTFAWPTGGTTRVLPTGEIILSEALISYQNCTTVLRQLIYNPSTNTTRTEVTTDPEGCKATTTTKSSPGGSTTPSTNSEPTTTFAWPTGGTTRVLPSGEIKATPTSPNSVGVWMSSPMTTTELTLPFTFPESQTTKILPSGEILLSESLVSYSNCTTVLFQLIYNPKTNTTRTEKISDPEGCKATTTSAQSSTVSKIVGKCASPSLDLNYSTRPTPSALMTSYSLGDQIVHICQAGYVFEYARQPFKVYQCMADGDWTGSPESCLIVMNYNLGMQMNRIAWI